MSISTAVAPRSRRRLAGAVAAAAFLFWTAPAARAASTLSFPRLTFENDRYVGIAIANPTARDAEVTLTAYDETGAPLAGGGLRNPVPLTVRANQQIARLTSELFGVSGRADTAAWFQATSPTDGLTGFFLYLDGAVTLLDGADLPVAAQRLLFSQVRVDGGFTTEIDVVNPGSATANVQAELWNGTAQPALRFFTLPPKGKKRFDVAAYFEVARVDPGAYISIQSEAAVAGIEFVRDPRGDLLGLNGRRVTEKLGRLAFPQLAVLGGYTTELGVVNLGDRPVILTVTAHKPSGALYDTANLKTNPVTRTLAAGAALREDLIALFGFTGSRTLDGWVEVQASADTVNGFLTYGLPETGAVAAVTGAPEGRTRALFSHIATRGYFTGVAALNAGTLAANVRIVALEPSGKVIGSFDGVLQPGERIARLLGTSELIPEAADLNGGLIWVKSDLPIFLASIFGSGDVLANIPPQSAPDAYAPDAGIATVKVGPPIAIVRPGKTQSFRADGVASPTWKVNGVAGGAAPTGTVSTAGLFTAPATVPARQTVTVAAESARQAGGASVDLLDRTTLFEGPRVIQSVGYLASLGRLYAAEFAALSASPGGPERLAAAPAGNSQVVEVAPGGARIVVATFNGENVGKMLPFTGVDGREYLILAGQTGGRLVRLDPAVRQFQDVVTNLREPAAIVFDPTTGDLLVAERDRITTVARSALNAGLVARAPEPGAPEFPPGLGIAGVTAPLVSIAGAAGLAADRCTGRIYLTLPVQGLLVEYDPATDSQRTVLSGLKSPGALLGLYRTGISCPDGFELLVSEHGAGRTLLVVPATGAAYDWVGGPGINDLAQLPSGNPYTTTEAIASGESVASTGSIGLFPVAGLYRTLPPNPPPVTVPEVRADVGLTGTAQPDPVAVGAVVTYTFNVLNKGPVSASGVTWRTALPPELGSPSASTSDGTCASGTECSLGALAAGKGATVTLRATVAAAPAGGVLALVGSVAARELDPDVNNNSATVRTTVTGGGVAAARLELTGLANPSTSGTAQTVTVRALSAAGAVVTGYAGTVRFTSTDPAAALPADYTFVAADRGVHVFTSGVTLRTPGPAVTVTVTDRAAANVSGSQTVAVNSASQSISLVITSTSATWTANAPNLLTVQALNPNGSVATQYRGTITFSSSDPLAVLPGQFTFTSGSQSFTGLRLVTTGSQAITVTDAANALKATLTVTVVSSGGGGGGGGGGGAGDASSFVITGLPASLAPGTPVSVTVRAIDVFGNPATLYRGTVRFTSTDPAATLPANYTFTASDGATRTFTGVVLRTPGVQTVTASDSVVAFLAGSQSTTVTATLATTPAR